VNNDLTCLGMILPWLRSTDLVVLDIGCNVGDFTKLCLDHFGYRIKTVYGFEPNPTAYREYDTQFGHQNKVRSIEKGVGATTGPLTLYVPYNTGDKQESSPKLGSVYDRPVFHTWGPEQVSKEIEIQVTTVDDWMSEHDGTTIDYLKIDVEGHELAVLHGAKKSLQSGKIAAGQFEYGETFRDSGTTLAQVVSFLGELGYSTFNSHNFSAPLPVTVEDNYQENNFVFVHRKLLGEATAARKSQQTTTLMDWSETYRDEPEAHRALTRAFEAEVDRNPQLKTHRDLIEESQQRFNMIYGHGNRSLHWFWKLVVDELSSDAKVLEIGVYKGQILSLWQLLGSMSGKRLHIFGVSPLVDPEFSPVNRGPYIFNLFRQFGLDLSDTHILDARSQDARAVTNLKSYGPYQLVYVDGDHSYEATVADIETYGDLVQTNGFLVVDDCCDYKQLPPGMFKGIQSVSAAVRDTLETDSRFIEILTVGHVRIWQRKNRNEDLTPEELWESISG
jgi:FkbM family methyltransferase